VSALGAGNPVAEARLAALARAREAVFLPVRPPGEERGHLLDLWGRRMGLAFPPRPDPWPVPQAWRDEAREGLTAAGVDPARPYSVIHPGAGSPRKCWPLDRFLDLARRLEAEGLGRAGVAKGGGPRLGTPVLILGPAEEERWAGRHRELRREFPILGSPALCALAGVLVGAAAYVGNDSGVSHLSAAVGTPTIAVFQRPTERHFAPRGARVRVVSSDGLEEVSVERVLKALMGAGGGPW
jgi:ADP-heptose:LPS heptosyltransferase